MNDVVLSDAGSSDKSPRYEANEIRRDNEWTTMGSPSGRNLARCENLSDRIRLALFLDNEMRF